MTCSTDLMRSSMILNGILNGILSMLTVEEVNSMGKGPLHCRAGSLFTCAIRERSINLRHVYTKQAALPRTRSRGCRFPV